MIDRSEPDCLENTTGHTPGQDNTGTGTLGPPTYFDVPNLTGETPHPPPDIGNFLILCESMATLPKATLLLLRFWFSNKFSDHIF